MPSLQLLAILLLLLLRETVLGLGDLKFARSQKGHKTDTQVRSSEVEREVFSLLLSRGPLGVSNRARRG
jgi:hypothetical protein